MNLTKRNRQLLITVVVLASLGGISVYAWRLLQPRHASIDVTIVSIDPATRSGVVRFVHPKSGEQYELRGELAPDCEIIVGGRPADVEAIQPGDRAHADGLFYRTGRIVATRLEVKGKAVTAADGAASSPSSPSTP